MNSDLEKIAQALVAPGKGILAADESSGTIEKRFKSIGVTSTPETRRDYREMLFRTPRLGDQISGAILYDETLRQKGRDGTLLVDVLKSQGILPGIKVDAGAKPLANFPGEKITEGLDKLRERMEEYRTLGARFTKWRAVISIGPNMPSRFCLELNARVLSRFAALSQEAGLVPIVEPEVLMDGDHTLERCEEVSLAAWHAVFHALIEHRVMLEGMLLKPNMVIAGQESAHQSSPGQVAEATVRCLKRAVPSVVPGIVFLSGGQDDIEATRNLNAINQVGNVPWQLSFSFGRALQSPALKAWNGKSENVNKGQAALALRARCNGTARAGKYKPEMESNS